MRGCTNAVRGSRRGSGEHALEVVDADGGARRGGASWGARGAVRAAAVGTADAPNEAVGHAGWTAVGSPGRGDGGVAGGVKSAVGDGHAELFF